MSRFWKAIYVATDDHQDDADTQIDILIRAGVLSDQDQGWEHNEEDDEVQPDNRCMACRAIDAPICEHVGADLASTERNVVAVNMKSKFMDQIQHDAVKMGIQTLAHDLGELERRLHDKSIGTVVHDLDRLVETINYARNALLK